MWKKCSAVNTFQSIYVAILSRKLAPYTTTVKNPNDVQCFPLPAAEKPYRPFCCLG